MKQAQNIAAKRLKRIRHIQKWAKDQEDRCKEILRPLGLGVHRADGYYVILEEGTNSHFNSDGLKAAIQESVWSPFWVTSDYVKISIKPTTAAAAPKHKLQVA
jgi:hypothetical protein